MLENEKLDQYSKEEKEELGALIAKIYQAQPNSVKKYFMKLQHIGVIKFCHNINFSFQ